MMVRTTHRIPPAACGPRAFTLVELLVVIGVVVILVGIAISVGRSVVHSGRERQTQFTLRVLDTALTEYIHSQDHLPRPWVVDPRSPGLAQPVIDGWARGGGGAPMEMPSTSLFMLQAREVPEVEAKLRDLDQQILRETDFDAPGSASGSPTYVTIVLDGWGRPIRYVHPAFGGLVHPPGDPSGFRHLTNDLQMQLPPGYSWGATEVRRSIEGDGATDGGVPLSNRPYFYSTGRSGDASNTEDNVYIARPRFQQN